MSNSHYQEVAKTIMNQIGFGDAADGRPGVNCMMDWGAKSFRWHAASEEDRHLGALSFRVNGLLFKGIVQVQLSYNDTYRVRFLKRYRDGDVREPIDDVYFDDLTRIIDTAIEHPGDKEQYAQLARQFMTEAMARV